MKYKFSHNFISYNAFLFFFYVIDFINLCAR